MRLTPNFTLSEFTYSPTAESLGLDNTPTEDQIARLGALCEAILEAWRDRFGPLKINSGFRSEELNRAVGGAPASQHKEGEAADVVPLEATIVDLALFAVDQGLPFDQLIVYPAENFVHVSHRGDGGNRGELLVSRHRTCAVITPGALKDMLPTEGD
jgi:zinc D-Ala-D-Ala carboxypeptidase